MTLKELKAGQSARIDRVGGDGALRQHFLDMGVIPGAELTLVRFAPMGDPMELRIHGYELTLRLADAAQIRVSRESEAVGEHNFEPEKRAAALKFATTRRKSLIFLVRRLTAAANSGIP